MSILTDFSEDAVNAATEANFLFFVDELKKIDGAEVYQGDDMIRVALPSVPHPLVNMVTRTRLSRLILMILSRTLWQFIQSATSLSSGRLNTSTPDNLGEKLAEHGMQVLGKNEVLVVDLETVTETANAPDGYEIKQVAT